MNHTIWQPLLQQLPDWIEAHAIDLPGHGRRYKECFSSLEDLVEDLSQQCDAYKKHQQPLLLVGWSLGALPCLQVARQSPQLVDGLLMTSTTPCFVSRGDWSAGVDVTVFDQFAESLKTDFSGTIRRFLSLQVKGSESGRKLLRELREKILQQPQPDQQSLDAGLSILKQVDLREQLPQISQPVSWALGGQDGLVKIELANVLETLMPAGQIKQYEKAGHAPFLSHAEEFAQQLIDIATSITVDEV